MRRIGIIGGGQLGRMAIEEARKYLARVEVLSPEYPSPALPELADATRIGPLDDYETILEFAEDLDVISYEIEGVSVEALGELERRGKTVLPGAGILAAVRDKYRQKELLRAAGIPTARFALVDGRAGDCRPRWPPRPRRSAAFPSSRRRGREATTDAAWPSFRGPTTIAPSTAPRSRRRRSTSRRSWPSSSRAPPTGTTAVFPCVEMIFDSRANLCDSVLAPAGIGAAQSGEAGRIALACVDALCEKSRRRLAPERIGRRLRRRDVPGPFGRSAGQRGRA